MAKLSSTAPDRPAAPPARTTRQTRSQSAEPTKPASRQKGRKIDATPQQTASGRERRQNNKAKGTARAASELATVQEDATRVEENEVQLPEERTVGSDPRRASALSAISGTTAKTSFSQEEIEMMDAEVMVDFLPPLASASDQLARCIAPAGAATTLDIWKELKRSGSKANKVLSARIQSVEVHKQSFGTTEYIRPDLVLRALLGATDVTEVAAASWRPENVFYKINLAQMLKSVLQMGEAADRDLRSSTALERLHTAFFDTISGHGFSLESMRFYLDLSVQVCITKLAASDEASPGTYSPGHVIDSVFLDEDGAFNQTEALRLDQLDEQRRTQSLTMVQETVDQLNTSFAGNTTGTKAAIGRLKSRFSWEEFKRQTLRYFEFRNQQLHEQIELAGGVTEIAGGLASEIGRRADARFVEDTKLKYAKPASKPRRSLGRKSDLEALKQRVSQQPVPMAQMTETSVAGLDHSIFVQADDKDGDPATAESGLQATDEPTQPRARKKWTDPQANATRIDPRFDLEETQAPVEPRAPSAFALGKRRRAQMEDDNDSHFEPTQDQGVQEDDGFQTQHQDFVAADQRRNEVSYGRGPQRNSHNVEQAPQGSGSSFRQSDTPGPSPAKRQRKNPGSELPSATQPLDRRDGELSASQQYALAKNIAKLDRVKASMERKVQVRKAWETEEEEALLNLIEQHGEGGISWAWLKKVDQDGGNQLNGRKAEDLRFKARNMKLTFLLGSRGDGDPEDSLPSNFQYVLLDKKAMDKLRERGIPYSQDRQRESTVVGSE